MGKKNVLWQTLTFSILVGLAYWVAWYIIASPYRILPGDDEYFIHNIRDIDKVRFFFSLSLASTYRLLSEWLSKSEVFLLVIIGANAITCSLIFGAIWAITRRISIAIGAAALFGVSTWPATFYYWGSYAPFIGLITVASFFFLVCSRWQSHEKRYLLAAGGFAACLPVTHVCGIPFVFTLFVSLVFLNRHAGIRELVKKILYFSLPFTLTLTSQFFLFEHLLRHVRSNFGQVAAAKQMFGFIPNIPFFSFFHILSVHDKLFTILFVITTLLLIGHWGRMDTQKREMALLGVFFVLFNGLVIDWLPFTKLSRSQYAAFPILIAALALGYWTFENQLFTNIKIAKGLALIAIVLLGYRQFHWGAEMRWAKQKGAAELERIAKDRKLYTLDNDLYGQQISGWVREPIQVIESIEQIDISIPSALVVGPTGKRSEITTVGACVQQNNKLPKDIPKDSRRIRLPHHAFFPTFMMESDICAPRYWHGEAPSYRDPNLQMKVYFLRTNKQEIRLGE